METDDDLLELAKKIHPDADEWKGFGLNFISDFLEFVKNLGGLFMAGCGSNFGPKMA